MNMSKEKIARMLLNAKAVALSPKKPFTFASGIKSPIYTDNRVLISKPYEREIIIEAYVKIIKSLKNQPDVIAGVATAGIPWAAWIAQRLGKPMVFVRSAAKEHGKGNQIEGHIKKGDNVVVIEDLVSTGGSTLSAASALRGINAEVLCCVAIFTYGLKEAKSNFKIAKLKLETLTNLEELITSAVKDGKIKSSEAELIRNWAKNPKEWGK